jgi:general secretion pathway protein N
VRHDDRRRTDAPEARDGDDRGSRICGHGDAFIPSPLRLLDLFDRTTVPEVKAPPPLSIAAMPPLAQFDIIKARPLFNADRKPDPLPPPPAPPKPAVVLGDLTQYRLVGTARDADTQLALVQKTGGQLLKFKPGDTFEGWKIDKIDDNGVAISGGDQHQVLAIPKASNRAQSP